VDSVADSLICTVAAVGAGEGVAETTAFVNIDEWLPQR
jgi:hypothetical protein